MTEREVQRRLTELDHGLFLDKEWSVLGYLKYVVKMQVPDAPPMEVLDWGNRPLSDELIAEVRRQEGSIHDAITHAIVNNAAVRELQRQAVQQEVEERAHEWQFEKRGDRTIYNLGASKPGKM